MSMQRRRFGTDQKATILKRYLVDKVPMSDLCDEYGIKPNQIYAWQKILFDNAEAAFHQVAKREASKLSAQEEKIARLEAKLAAEERGHLRTDGGERPGKKIHWGTLNGRWVPHDTRDEVVDYVRRWHERTEIPARQFVGWLGIGQSKFHDWKDRYGKRNEHNGWVPRDWWLEDWEKQAIIRFSFEYPLEGYRRLAFMMLDRDVVAVSPSSVYRVLKAAGRIGRSTNKPSKKGTGFHQPQKPHEHWHIDISYINIHGTFYYLTTILDGYSRYIVHWEIRRSMTEQDELVVLQRAKEKFPNETPRIISDNGSQFLAKDFKEFIRICGMTHVRTSPYYPQSNGKLERFHGSIKGECIRPGTPISLEDAIRIVGRYVEHYNQVRLHSAIGYIAPADKLAGREAEIFAARDRKLAEARERRKEQREAARLQTVA